MTPFASQSPSVFRMRAASALGFSAIVLLLGAPAQLGFVKSSASNRRDAPAVAGFELDDVFYAPTDAEPGADRRWSFPRLNAAQLRVGERMIFTLPGARAVEMPMVSRHQVTPDSISFTFADSSIGASAEVSIHHGIVRGTVRATFGGRHEAWSLATDGANELYSERVEGGPCAGCLRPDGDGGLNQQGDGGTAGLCNDSARLIDVLTAYTPEVAATFPSASALESALSAAFATANAALANSEVLTRYRIVGFHPLATNGSGNLAVDLAAAANPADGVWDELHAERDAAGADLVQCFTGTTGGGIAYLGAGEPAFGFSVCGGIDGLLTAHELGHNLGCCHAVGDGGGCDSGGFYRFSNGWRFTSGNSVYRTVMAYDPGTWIPHFSNPLVSYLDVPTGVAETTATAGANNARTIGMLAYTVANYRCSVALETDCDGDGVIDSDAIATGLVPDCNLTGLPDSCDIAIGISTDLDSDGVPDDCPLTDLELGAGSLTPLDVYGTAVGASTRSNDISTSLVISGAPGNDTGAPRAGAAYLYRLLDGQLITTSILQSSPPKANAYFGGGAAVLRRPGSPTSPAYPPREFALVGAYRENESIAGSNYQSKGAVYCFAYIGSTWTQVWRYTPASNFFNTRDNSLFGYSVAMGRQPRESREQIIIGSPGQEGGSGRVFFLQNKALTDSQTSFTWNNPSSRRLQPLNAGDQDNFGYSVALEAQLYVTNGDVDNYRVIALAGAPGRDQGRGAVVVYDRSYLPDRPDTIGNFPTGGIVLTPPNDDGSAPGDRFGSAVAIDQNFIAIGAPNAKNGRGRVYFWERRTDVIPVVTGVYVYRGFFEAPDSVEGDKLGTSVAISRPNDAIGYIVTVGAPDAAVDMPGGIRQDAGKVYVLRKLLGQSGASIIDVRTARTPATGDRFGSSAAGTWGTSVIGAPFNDDFGLNAGKIRILSTP